MAADFVVYPSGYTFGFVQVRDDPKIIWVKYGKHKMRDFVRDNENELHALHRLLKNLNND